MDYNREGTPVFTDGPFIESKEYLAGLWIIEAADLDVALRLAAEGSEACSAVEHRPTELVSHPLVVQDELANRRRQLVALPRALQPAGLLTGASRSCRTHGLDRVGGGSELVRGDVRHHGRLAGSERRVS